MILSCLTRSYCYHSYRQSFFLLLCPLAKSPYFYGYPSSHSIFVIQEYPHETNITEFRLFYFFYPQPNICTTSYPCLNSVALILDFVKHFIALAKVNGNYWQLLLSIGNALLFEKIGHFGFVMLVAFHVLTHLLFKFLFVFRRLSLTYRPFQIGVNQFNRIEFG